MEIGSSMLLGDVQTLRRDYPCAISSQKQMNAVLQGWRTESEGRKPLMTPRLSRLLQRVIGKGFEKSHWVF